MSYKFVKLHDTRTGLDYPWILECKNMATLMEHTEKCMGHTIREGVQDWFDKQKQSIKLKEDYTYVPHYTTRWAGVAQSFAEMKGTNFIKESTLLENEVHKGKSFAVIEGKTLYLREMGSYMVHTDSIEVTDIFESDTLVYPEYAESDIKITKWPSGSHFYAKIGNMDVIDKDGNQKWNTHKRAYEVALNELKNIEKNEEF